MEEDLRVCVVGLGHWGPNILGAFAAHPRAVVVAAAERSAERREVVAGRLPHVPVYESLGACLDRHEFDAVAIAVPVARHFEVGMQALDAGKHLWVEKPLAANRDQAEALVRRAAELGRVLMVGHVFLYNEGVRYAKRLIDSGELGEVFYMRSVRTNLGPIREDVNALWDLASHDISIFNALMGCSPVSVSCSLFSPLSRLQADMAQGTLRYAGGRAGMFFVSWLDPTKVRQLTVVGSEKMLLFDDMAPNRPIQLFHRKVVAVKEETPFVDTFHAFRMSIRDGDVVMPSLHTGEPLRNECADFVECALEGGAPLSGGAFGVEVVRILEALEQSARRDGVAVAMGEGA